MERARVSLTGWSWLVSQIVNVQIPIHFHLADLNGPGHSSTDQQINGYLPVTSHLVEFRPDFCLKYMSLKFNPEELGLLKFMQHPLYENILDKILLTNQQFFA